MIVYSLVFVLTLHQGVSFVYQNTSSIGPFRVARGEFRGDDSDSIRSDGGKTDETFSQFHE